MRLLRLDCSMAWFAFCRWYQLYGSLNMSLMVALVVVQGVVELSLALCVYFTLNSLSFLGVSLKLAFLWKFPNWTNWVLLKSVSLAVLLATVPAVIVTLKSNSSFLLVMFAIESKTLSSPVKIYLFAHVSTWQQSTEKSDFLFGKRTFQGQVSDKKGKYSFGHWSI